jgi:hypothetical protein
MVLEICILDSFWRTSPKFLTYKKTYTKMVLFAVEECNVPKFRIHSGSGLKYIMKGSMFEFHNKNQVVIGR